MEHPSPVALAKTLRDAKGSFAVVACSVAHQCTMCPARSRMAPARDSGRMKYRSFNEGLHADMFHNRTDTAHPANVPTIVDKAMRCKAMM